MATVSPDPGVRSVTTDDGAVLLDLKTGKFFGLNPTAAAVWDGLNTGKDLPTLVVELAPRFGVSKERLSTDIHNLIEILLLHGLVDGGKAET